MKNKEFVQGYVCAVANICKSHDPGTPVEEALRDCGMTSIAKMRAAGVDNYDIDILRPSIKALQVRKRRTK